MKKIIFLNIIAICFPVISFCQWSNHYFFNIAVIPPPIRTSEFSGAIFTSSDTGYYCYTVDAPSPSTAADLYLKETTDDCNTWDTAYAATDIGISSDAVKYFKPYIFFLWNWQGILKIDWKKENSSWQSLPVSPILDGFYLDFFATDSSNYKVLWQNFSGNKCMLRYVQNDSVIRSDTFLTNLPTRMFFPLDTLGVFLNSTNFPSSNWNNQIITKYTPSEGYNIVYQNQNQKLNDLYFPSVNVGYVAGDSGIVLRSNDLGSSWTNLNTGYNSQLNSVFFINDSTGYVVGDSGLILQTTNYGLSWQQQSSPINSSLNKVFFVNDTVGFILSGQTLLKTTNGGAMWINKNPSTTNDISIYPNPSIQTFNIVSAEGFTQMPQVTNLLGQKVDVKFKKLSNTKLQLDMSNQPKGIYLIRIGNTVRKLMLE